MNLLKDRWIPVRKNSIYQQISYKELLCTDTNYQVALPRDDLELACIQLLASMTQAMFAPEDGKELKKRVEIPLSENEFDEGIKKCSELFDLDHPKWPFMQTLDTGTDKLTPVQKLFPGLPAGNNHAFFNECDELKNVCPSCVAIGLFNLCTNTPNLSGKHKGGLRGGAPISTMIYNGDIRKVVWLNTLSVETVKEVFIGERVDEPVWVKPLEKGKKYSSAEIGLIRGLFWTPILVKLKKNQNAGICDLCKSESKEMISEFYLGSEFIFDVLGFWPHPYSPRQLNLQRENKKGKKKPEESVLSFRTTRPAWTQFTELLFHRERTEKVEGYIPALVVTQFNRIYPNKEIHFVIGGYRNKQAAILQRRHELYSMPAGWSDDLRDKITEIIKIGLEAEAILTNKVLYPLVKGNKDKGISGIGVAIHNKASDIYFHLTESIVHAMLREFNLRDFCAARIEFVGHVSQICLEIFERVTSPYLHKPELIGSINIMRVKLIKLLKELEQTHTV